MTAHDRTGLRVRYLAAQERAVRAADQGDRAGALIAAGDARRILARLTDDMAQRAAAVR